MFLTEEKSKYTMLPIILDPRTKAISISLWRHQPVKYRYHKDVGKPLRLDQNRQGASPASEY